MGNLVPPAAVAVDTNLTLVAASNSARTCLTIMPTDGDIEVGPSGFAFGDGWPVASGEAWEERDDTGAVFARAAAGTVDVRVRDVG